MITYSLEVALKITPLQFWHAGSGLGSAHIHRQILRDGIGRPYMPGSHLKGILRQKCEDLAETLGLPISDPHDVRDLKGFKDPKTTDFHIDRLFGSRYEGGHLFVRPAYWLDDGQTEYYERSSIMEQTRTAMDRALGTAKEQHLFQSEYALGGNFETTISGRHNYLTAEEQKSWPIEYAILIGGLCLLDRMGGDKSHGKGRIETSIQEILFNGTSITKEEALKPLSEKDMPTWVDLLRKELYGD